MTTTYLSIATRIGALVDAKSEAYGPALTNTARHLEILWPNGIPPKDYHLAGLYTRMLDKMARGANGHLDDVGADLAGYGLMLEKTYQESQVKVVVGRGDEHEERLREKAEQILAEEYEQWMSSPDPIPKFCDAKGCRELAVLLMVDGDRWCISHKPQVTQTPPPIPAVVTPSGVPEGNDIPLISFDPNTQTWGYVPFSST